MERFCFLKKKNMPPLKVRHYEEKVVFEILGAFLGNYSHTNWNSSVKYQPSFFLRLVTKVTKVTKEKFGFVC